MYYVIRHKQTGECMPQMKADKGYSFWLYDQNKDNHLPHPRLFPTEKKAKKAAHEWAKGIFEWYNAGDDPLAFDQRRRIRKLNRHIEELEIFPVVIAEVLGG